MTFNRCVARIMRRIHELHIKFHVVLEIYTEGNTGQGNLNLNHDWIIGLIRALGISDTWYPGTCSTVASSGRPQRFVFVPTFEQDVDRTGRIAALANSKVLLVYDLENPDKVRVPKDALHVSPRPMPSCQR